MGKLYFDKQNPQLCEKIPQQEFNFRKVDIKPKDDDEDEEPFLTPFMIADRGKCSFVQKVRNMEEAGVAVAIVIDDTDEDINSIVMSDDCSGAGIRIPSMLISKADGIKIVDGDLTDASF